MAKIALTITEDLDVALTEAELMNRGQALAEREEEVEALREERSSVIKEYNRKIHGVNTEILRLAFDINRGAETRPVKCEVQYLVPQRIKRIIRTDTFAEVREEPMTEAEVEAQTQTQMFESTPALPVSSNGPDVPAPVKRGRGRPRKNPSVA